MLPKLVTIVEYFPPKQNWNTFFRELKVLSTKVDNICGTKAIRGKICLNELFKTLVESNAT